MNVQFLQCKLNHHGRPEGDLVGVCKEESIAERRVHEFLLSVELTVRYYV